MSINSRLSKIVSSTVSKCTDMDTYYSICMYVQMYGYVYT